MEPSAVWDAVGGPLQPPPGDALRLRVLLDGSCLEVFTGEGQASQSLWHAVPDCC